MAIGERIRFFRNLRGMTQKRLGTIIGFSEKGPDVRIAQYESGSRVPKDNLVKAFAKALGVSPRALLVPNIDNDLDFVHTLFAIEDIYNVKVIRKKSKVYIVFDCGKPYVNLSLSQMLIDWAKQANKYRMGEISKEQYDRWRYTYPDYTKTRNTTD